MRGKGVRAATAVAVACIALLAALACGGCRSEASHAKASEDGPVAVVLVHTKSGSELDVVDLSTMRLARRVKLRSLCLEIAADARTRTVVTAQCGGPDRSADDAAGIYRIGERKVRYVELGIPNPLDVATAGGVALLVHGFERSGRLVTTRMDVATQHVLGHGSLGPGALAPLAWRDGFIVPEIDVASDPLACSLVAMDRDGRASALGSLDARRAALVAPEAGAAGPPRLILSRASEPGSDASWSLARLGASGIESEAPISALRYGVADACMWGELLAVADADGVDMSDPGDTLWVFDPGTGEQKLALRIAGGMPAAVASWQGRLLVADGVSGDLLEYASDGRLRSRLKLGGAPVGSAALVVVP